MGNVTDVTDATFDALVVKSDKPVLIDYWADWCAPCRQLSPIIEELAGEYSDKVTFLKMDTNANTAVPTAQGVLSLPTIQIFVGGEVAKQF
ncbi:MAG TPA: thiol reductase thioredoxin, partial [Propionibacteriaceae bacterium]|nr:thiol reductase thioredoxin [Propionibacteriaceae bacterium]